MRMSLSDKIAMVTGSSRGIGRAIALAFAEAGAHLVINFVKNHGAADEVKKAIEALGRSCLAVEADVSNAGQVKAMVEK